MMKLHVFIAVAPMLFLSACMRQVPPVVVDYPPALFETMDSVHLDQRITHHMSGRVEHMFYVFTDSVGHQIMHGPDVLFYLSGNRKQIQYWRKGKLFGPATFWHDNGALQGFSVYRDGVLNGPAKSYDEDGHLKVTKYWKAGKLFGPQTEYDSKGNITQTRWWKDNVPVKEPDSILRADTVRTDTLHKPQLQIDTLARQPIDTGLPSPHPQYLLKP